MFELHCVNTWLIRKIRTHRLTVQMERPVMRKSLVETQVTHLATTFNIKENEDDCSTDGIHLSVEVSCLLIID